MLSDLFDVQISKISSNGATFGLMDRCEGMIKYIMWKYCIVCVLS